MAVKIQVRRGSKSNLPTLSPGEWGLTTDTSEVYIGGSSANIRVATEQDINELQQLISSGEISSVSVTAQASAWSSNSITIQVAGLPAQSTAWIGLAIPNTAAQREAVRNGAISPTARSGGSITLTADGSQPTVDLPLIVYYGPASAAATAAVLNMLPTGATLQIPLDSCTNFSAKAGNAQVELTWTDPLDKYATPEGEVSETGDQLVSEWDHTVLVRKTGSQPAGPNDGTVVTSSSVRNQYQTNGYTDTGLINDTVYYYAVFAYNKDGVASEGAFASAMPRAGTPLSELAEGTIIKINENGSPVEFYLAKHNYEPGLNGEGRELVVRKDMYDNRVWNSSIGATWNTCDLRTWMNSNYKGMFDSSVQSLMGTTRYYFTVWRFTDWIVTNGADSVFSLSSAELSDITTSIKMEGSLLPTADILKVGVVQWTRTIDTTMRYTSDGAIYYITDGSRRGENMTHSNGARPCFTLPSTALVDSNLALIETA